jgi:hypothetical protein
MYFVKYSTNTGLLYCICTFCTFCVLFIACWWETTRLYFLLAMTGSDFDSPLLSPLLGFLGISAHLRYLLWRRQTVSQNNGFESIQEVPESVTWLNVQSFRVVSAICGKVVLLL